MDYILWCVPYAVGVAFVLFILGYIALRIYQVWKENRVVADPSIAVPHIRLVEPPVHCSRTVPPDVMVRMRERMQQAIQVDRVCNYCGELKSSHPVTLSELEACAGKY